VIAETANGASRKAILALAESPRLDHLVRKHGMRLGAARFVAGETLDQLVPVLRRLNEQGLLTNTTLLGEHVHTPDESRAVVDAYQEVLDRIAAERLKTNVALKLTHLGLDLDEELAYENVSTLIEHAAGLGNFVRMDMEESRWVDATLRIYRRLREAGHENTGTVLQSYLYRTETDLESLLDLQPNLRFVQGRSLREGGFTAIATHDEALIEHSIAFAEREGIPRGRFQFQMLYGVRPQVQLELVARGFAVLVATPFGPDWYRYLMRRLAERPANTFFFLKNLVRR